MSRPSIPTLRFGLGKGPKIIVATSSQRDELVGSDDQTTDLTSLTRPSLTLPEIQEVKPKVPVKQSTIQPMFAKRKKESTIQPTDSAAQPTTAQEELPEEKESTVPLSQFSEELQEYAMDILGMEHSNPYRLKKVLFPLQSRLGFQTQILNVFSDFIKVPEVGEKPDFDACKKLGSSAQQQVEMYEYQQFVREYVRQATPYRGLLVYHGLGSGKTCSAIAAAEALFSVNNKKIIVMTPFSLRDNFIREVTFCGFRHFRIQNFWVKLDASEDPTIKLFAQTVLHLPESYLKKTSEIWVPDFDQPSSNFSTLSDIDRNTIQTQLNIQINSRITFLNYNGISASKLKEMACAPADEDGYGFFDNAVIVIDEIHNITRLMQGTIEPYLTALPTKKTRKIPLEPITPGRWEPKLCAVVTDKRRPYLTNYKRGYLLYRMLATARNSKIIGLSGTPLINFPEEIAILANVLGGYIYTVSFLCSQPSDTTLQTIRTLLKDHPFIDFESCEAQGLNISVLFTILPEGMRKKRDATGVLGVERIRETPPTILTVTDQIIGTLTEQGIKIVRPPEFKAEPLLPPVGEEFRQYFLNKDGTTIQNSIVLRKRLQGLISYYRGSKKELMPEVIRDEVVRVPLTPYAQAEYTRVRGEELKQELEVRKKSPQESVEGMDKRMSNLWAELYDLAKMKTPNSYRMFSRQSCNFSFPEGIARPRPRNQQEAIHEIGSAKENDIIDGDSAPLPDVSLRLASDSEDTANEEDAADEEDKAIEESAVRAAIEDAQNEGQAQEAIQLAKEGETVLIEELPPAAVEGELVPAAEAKTLTGVALAKQKQEKEKELCKKGILAGEQYPVATRRAKKCLENFAATRLRLYPPGKKTIQERKAGTPADPSRLQKYSPKFAKMLESILDSPGSNLVYSQFLDMEGIGIFLIVLKINEFQPIVLESDDAGSFRFSAETIRSFQKGPTQYRYLSFTGSESREQRRMALRVFNARYSTQDGVGSFTELPPAMSQVLVDAGFTGNLQGELCRVFCITSAGAEGLSLKNVRRVQIMEPYWNHVRTDQVKGRAVRICSHIDLDYNEVPELNQRTVEVFTYCSVFDPQAMLPSDASAFPRIDQTILQGDGMKPTEATGLGFPVPPGAKEYVLTSDEYLVLLSEKKKQVLQNIQNLMKTSAVDCKINQYENQEDGLGCITLPGTPEQYAYHPILVKDIAETTSALREGTIEVPEPLPQVKEPVVAPSTEKQVIKPPTKSIQARQIVVNGIAYLAVPTKGPVIPLQYDLYARGDVYRVKKLGTTLADSQGQPTADVTMFGNY
jgi:hypothetical protein